MGTTPGAAAAGNVVGMQIAVDMTRCQSYAQCCFLAPQDFRFEGDQALVYDPRPDDAHRSEVLRAAAACPVQAIRIDHRDLPTRVSVPPPRTRERVVVVGSSLAGLRAAEAVRREGFSGHVVMVGAEPHEPYDRPPLSKQVLSGMTAADHTILPRFLDLDAEWRLGVTATGLDLATQDVLLAGGERLGYDRLVIATGSRARPWPHEAEADLTGVHTLRTADDAAQVRARLQDGPRRVLVVGGGFTGSEVASVCRDLDLPVALVDRGPAPLTSGLGEEVGGVAADLQREHGVDLRTRTSVTAFEGDGSGQLRRAHLSDGSTLDVDVAVVALGAVRNVEWLQGSEIDANEGGVRVDVNCRVLDRAGHVVPNVFAAGDVTRFPSPILGGDVLSVEHWGNAVAQAEVAAHNLVTGGEERHDSVPVFWSLQFGHVLKAVGVPALAQESAVVQGSLASRSFVVAYGARGLLVGAVAMNQSTWLDHYARQITAAAPFPPRDPTVDRPKHLNPEHLERTR